VTPALKNHLCLSAAGASLMILAGGATNFSHETGAILTFFAYFFVSRQKSKWGLRGKTPYSDGYGAECLVINYSESALITNH
jgi:uncharacterized membrane protein YphA (DoxX/SURF4 family)